jgi:serine/threonine-protein kinase
MDIPTTDPLVGLLVDGRYLIQSRVARGGMATVYQALDQRLERPVAIKVMHPHLAEDAEFTRRFIQEARQAARLAHPNIVNVFDQGQEGALTYIVMEYLPGITLRELLQDFGALTVGQTLDIVTAVLNGLDAAHTAGIVHRDLKPENLLLADDGRIKIADFGLARASTHNTATSQALLGTIAYLSPELISRGEADLRSDIYALGIMMFEMLTGEQPYQGDQAVTIAYQHANDIVPAPSTKNPDIPAAFDELVDWCTRRSPDERPPHARAVLEHVRSLESLVGAPHTQPLRTLDQTIAMTKRMSPLDLEETQVLNPKAGVFDGLEPTSSIGIISQDTAEIPPQEPVARRRNRGGSQWAWISAFILVVVIGGGGGAALWWANGPGAMTTVPDVSGISVSSATTTLVAAELVVSATPLEEFDLVLSAGTVKGTSPGSGENVDKGTEVTLIVSLGPNPVSVPSLAGETLESARALLEELNLILGVTREEFSARAAEGTLLRLTDTSGLALAPGSEILAGSTLDAVLSAGVIPDVTGLTVDEAQTMLDQVGLSGVVGGDGAYSDSIAEGSVVEIFAATTQTFAPGDTLTLVVSRGPELVMVPDVVGDTIAAAKAELESLGFSVEVRSEYPESDWDRSFARVTSIDPSASQEVVRGTTITLRSFV